MKNLHLEHPEDTILNGDLSVLDWFEHKAYWSVKIDGAPAIVWGKCPATGEFFVGTKSVFNKVKIKINYTHEDIERNHEGQVADILHVALECLPSTDNIYQGDFIGFGGDNVYQPNTITYVFDEVITEHFIIAPHTQYHIDEEMEELCLRNTIATPLLFDLGDTEKCKFVKPKVFTMEEDDIANVCWFARQMSTLCKFVDDKKAALIKKDINSCIRFGLPIKDDDFDCDPNLIRLWKLIKSIKEDLLFMCENDGPRAYIKLKEIDAEGYVRANGKGYYKLVNREVFSYANFNNGKFQRVTS